MSRARALATSHSALSTLAVISLLLYALLWTPAYRLNERFEYADLLLTAFPWIAHLLAWQLALVRAVLPAAAGTYQATAVLLCGLLVALFALYGLALVVVSRVSRRAALATLLGATLAWQIVLLPLPGVFTTDLFSYAMYGEIAGRFGESPYVQSPDDYPDHPLYLLINPLWRDAPSVYGPIWIALSSAVGAALGGQVLAEVLAYRLIADLCHWLNLGLLWWTLRRLRPGAEPLGLALYAWNPLVVLEFAANGHNDGTMLTFVLLCVALLARDRAWAAVAALVASMGTKYTTIVLLPLVLWWAVRERRGWRRFALAATGGLAGAVVIALSYLPWWRGPATLGPVIYWLSTPMYANYAPIALAGWARDRLVEMGWPWEHAEPLVFGIQRQVVRIAYLVYVAVETLRFAPLAPPTVTASTVGTSGPGRRARLARLGQRSRLGRALGRGLTVLCRAVGALCRPTRGLADLPSAAARILLIFLLAVNTWVLPWYFTWPLALAALGNPRSRTTWLTVGFSASAPLSMYWAQTHFESLQPLGFAFYLAPLALLALWEVVHGLRRAWGPRHLGWSPRPDAA